MIWDKLKAWLAIGVGALLAFGGLALAIFTKGRASREREVQQAKAATVEAKADAVQATAAAKASHASATAVAETAQEVAAMPDAGPQRVGDAAAGTAADWLKQNANRNRP